jgi:hypothetical protein
VYRLCSYRTYVHLYTSVRARPGSSRAARAEAAHRLALSLSLVFTGCVQRSLLTGSLCLSHSRPGSSRAARAEAAHRLALSLSLVQHLCCAATPARPCTYVHLYTLACTPAHLCCTATPRATPLLRSDTCAYLCLYTSTPLPLHLHTFASTPLHLCCAATPARTPSPDAPRAASLRSAVHELPHMTGHLSHTCTIGQTSLSETPQAPHLSETPQSHLYYWTDVAVLDRYCRSTLI